MEIFKKVSNIIKNKLIGELIYSKTHQKVEKKQQQKNKNKQTCKHKRRLSMFICTNNID